MRDKGLIEAAKKKKQNQFKSSPIKEVVVPIQLKSTERLNEKQPSIIKSFETHKFGKLMRA